MKLRHIVGTVAVSTLLGGCGWDGGPVITSDTDHKINVGGSLTDSKPLAVQVRQKLKSNAQTLLARIQVSSPSEDTVRLAGTVENDSVRNEAERLAYQVNGVRFVVNTLSIAR